MDTKEILQTLTKTPGVSGEENAVCRQALKMLDDMGIKGSIDCNANSVFASLSAVDENKPTLMLEAHIDEIGMTVTHITDEGFLKVSNCGGLDRRVLLASQVTVYGREAIKGVVTSTPPHLEKDSSLVPQIEDIYIDIGLSKEQAENAVSLGDKVLIENDLADMQNGRVTSKALDNRSGVCAVILALEMLKDKKLNCNVSALFASQEEVGERGAAMGAYTAAPDMAVIVDVSFAKTHYESEEDCGKLSGGPMIGIAPSLDRKMSYDFISIAAEKSIPYQLEVMNGKTGTDADVIGVSRGGVRTVTVSIPEKYMHTPVEIVDTKDIENTAKLIAAFAESV